MARALDPEIQALLAAAGPVRAVQIGKMVIIPMGDGKVWLTWKDTAEGMQCDESKLADWLERFYREHF